MILQKSGNTETFKLQIDGKLIKIVNSVKLIGINTDNKFSLADHISDLFNKAFLQLSVISTSYRTVPSAIWQIFHEFLILHEANVRQLVYH